MICRTLEIRDSMTMIPAMAILLEPRCERDRQLLARAGYGRHVYEQSRYVMLMRADGSKCEVDPFSWGDRTMHTVHMHLGELGWNSWESGDVFDVEYILGEVERPKDSES